MKSLIFASSLLTTVLTAGTTLKPAQTAKLFLSSLYGAEVDLAAICHPHEDLWMLPGPSNPAGQKAVAAENIALDETGVFAGLIEHDFCVVEMRQGKVDPAYNLDSIYLLQRQLVLRFLYYSLLQDKSELAGLVTNSTNLDFGRVKVASPGDMDVYEGLLGLLPVVRASEPKHDRESRSVSYRVPLGTDGFVMKLVKQGSSWKVDTSNKLTVPLELFWR